MRSAHLYIQRRPTYCGSIMNSHPFAPARTDNNVPKLCSSRRARVISPMHPHTQALSRVAIDTHNLNCGATRAITLFIALSLALSHSPVIPCMCLHHMCCCSVLVFATFSILVARARAIAHARICLTLLLVPGVRFTAAAAAAAGACYLRARRTRARAWRMRILVWSPCRAHSRVSTLHR